MPSPLGDYIREQRGNRSQTELAESAGLQRAHLSEIERGKIALPSADIRRRLAKALGVSHLDLLVAAGEITRDELGSVAGVVERDPDDPRERLLRRIQELPRIDRIDWALELVVSGLEDDPEIEARKR